VLVGTIAAREGWIDGADGTGTGAGDSVAEVGAEVVAVDGFVVFEGAFPACPFTC
jgi:hypothetical protein